MDTIVWPDKYFPVDVRNGQRTIQGVHARAGFVITAREYLRKVASEAKKRHITFFFEVCEIWYPDGLTELYPEILGAKGTVCPTSPFWWEFLGAKYTELFDIIPDLDGVIVSPGTFESKLSISMHTCFCESCSSTTPLDWYTKLISSMYAPIESRGKQQPLRLQPPQERVERTFVDRKALFRQEILQRVTVLLLVELRKNRQDQGAATQFEGEVV